jgi:MFS family permease
MLSSVFGGLGQLIGLTVTGLLIKDMLGSATWIGTGNAAMQLGTAAGAFTLSRLMNREGRRPGLALGYLIGVGGGVIIALSDRWGWYPLLLIGLFLFGVANTANQQARFAAADVVPDERRARAVGVVVWSTTIGVVLGPILSGPLGRAVEPLGIPEYGGAFLVGGSVFILAALVCWMMLRPDPLAISRELRPVAPNAPAVVVDVRECLRRPMVRMAIAALVIGQFVMVGIMSTTSVHLKDHGHSTSSVGVTISLHVLGMYAAAPITGWLSDRLGRIPVIAGGGLLMAVSGVLASVAPPEGSFAINTALLLLGLGWNMNFVAGSALLTDAVTPAERPRLQGVTDMATFIAAAGAAMAGGFILNSAGYSSVAVGGAAFAGAAMIVVLAFRHAATPEAGAASPGPSAGAPLGSESGDDRGAQSVETSSSAG